jgi:hypothetical protein
MTMAIPLSPIVREAGIAQKIHRPSSIVGARGRWHA